MITANSTDPPPNSISRTATIELHPYQYTPLESSKSLRVIALQGAQDYNAAIVCRFEIIDFGSVHENPVFDSNIPLPKNYEALSWCWGNQQRDRSIEIYEEGVAYQFSITQNLDEALRGLRYGDRQRYLWVDYLCIDQTSRDERTQQVPNMKIIYGGAKSVCVWIGSGDKTTNDAFDFIGKLLNVWDFDAMNECVNIDRLLKAFWKLLNHPWFSRRWIVQEIALARAAKLFCGTSSIDWADFAIAVSLFVVYNSESNFFSSRIQDRSIRDPFDNASETGAATLIEATNALFRRSEKGQSEPLLSLEYLISKFTVFEATQPRDTIYALLAISKDTTAKEKVFTLLDIWDQHLEGSSHPVVQLTLRAIGRSKNMDRDFKVNYNEDVIDVYRRLIEFCIRRSEPIRALDILCRPWAPRFTARDEMAGFHESLDGSMAFGRSHQREINADDDEQLIELPSWVGTQDEKPFAMKATGGQLDAFKKMYRTSADPLVGHPIAGQRAYTANGHFSLRLEDVKFEKVGSRGGTYKMFIKGFIIDEVDKVEDASREGIIPASWLSTGGWTKFHDGPPEDFWRTLVANRGPNSTNVPAFYRKACQEAWKQRHGDSQDLNTSDLMSEGNSSVIRTFLQRVRAVTWRRSLLRTSDGRLGLGYKNAQKGDFVSILYGCSVPVIMRKHNNRAADFDRLERLKEQEIEDKVREAAQLVTKMRKRQLGYRFKQRQQVWSWILHKIRALWLTWGLLLYLALVPPADSFRDVFVLFFALSVSSASELKVLGPPWIRKIGQWWWNFSDQNPITRLLLFVLLTMFSISICRATVHLRIAISISAILFPSLPLRPFGLYGNFTDLVSGKYCLRVMMRSRIIVKTALDRLQACKNRLAILLCPRLWWYTPQDEVISLISTDNTNNSQNLGHYWELIGPAYIHGIMDGEAVGLQAEIMAETTDAFRYAKTAQQDIDPKYLGRRRNKFAERQTFEIR